MSEATMPDAEARAIAHFDKYVGPLVLMMQRHAFEEIRHHYITSQVHGVKHGRDDVKVSEEVGIAGPGSVTSLYEALANARALGGFGTTDGPDEMEPKEPVTAGPDSAASLSDVLGKARLSNANARAFYPNIRVGEKP